MVIGLVGSEGTIENSLSSIDSEKEMFEVKVFPYSIYDARTFSKEIDGIQKQVDAILFTGSFYYSVASESTVPSIPWAYGVRTKDSILKVLFRAYIDGNKLNHITFDLRDTSIEQMKGIIQEVTQIKDEELDLFKYDVQMEDYSSSDYFSKLEDFHVAQLRSGRANLCITSMQQIAKSLRAKGYEVYSVIPSKDDVRNAIHRLINQCSFQQQRKLFGNDKPTVMRIQVSYKGSESTSLSKQIRCDYLVRNCICNFGQSISAAVKEESPGNFFLYSMKNELEDVTKGLSELGFINILKHIDGVNGVHVGIGIGSSAAYADENAVRSLSAACKQGCDYYFKEDNGLPQGPFYSGVSTTERSHSDINLERISRNTGIGVHILEKLRKAQEKYGFNTATSAELAEMCELTISSMNRIIVRLQETGYVEVFSHRPHNGAGRPSREIKLLLD